MFSRHNVLLLLTVVLLCAVPVHAQITHLSTATAANVDNSVTLTFSVTNAGCANSLIAVPVGTRNIGGSNAISTVTFNGDSLTAAIQETDVTASSLGASVWYRLAPDVATGDVVVTAAGEQDSIAATAVILCGVDQATPLNDLGIGRAATATEVLLGTGTGSNALTTTIDGCAVVDAMATNAGPDVVSMAAETNRTQSTIQNIGPSDDDQMAASRIVNKTSAGAVTMQWNISGSGNATLVAASFAPAASTGPPAGSLMLLGVGK